MVQVTFDAGLRIVDRFYVLGARMSYLHNRVNGRKRKLPSGVRNYETLTKYTKLEYVVKPREKKKGNSKSFVQRISANRQET